MIYLAFNETEPLTGGTVAASTRAALLLAGVNRAGFSVGGATTTTAAIGSDLTSGWIHFRCTPTTTSGSSVMMEMSARNSAGTKAFAISQAGNTNFTLTVHSDGGAALTFPLTMSVGNTIDINFLLGVDGYVRVYRNEALAVVHNGTLTMTSGNQNVTSVAFSAPASGIASYWSQVIVADVSTIGGKVYTLALTSTADTDVIGTVSNITTTAYAAPANYVRATAAGQRLQLTQTLPALGDGETIHSVMLAVSALKDLPPEYASIGNQLDPLLKYEGNFIEGNDPFVLSGSAFTRKMWNWATHPQTGVAWTRDTLNATAIGMIAEAA